MPLAPLTDEAARELASILLPGVLDEDDKTEIVARAEGNPLYVEELLQALVEGSGLVRRSPGR